MDKARRKKRVKVSNNGRGTLIPISGARQAKALAVASSASLAVAKRGIRSSADYKDFMSALMSDVVGERLNPSITNAACNAAGKLAAMVRMEMQFGSPRKNSNTLQLVSGK